MLIEKVRVATRGPCRAPAMAAITGFDDIVAAVAADPAFRADIARVLGELRARTPDEALHLLGLGALDSDAADAVEAAADAVLAAVDGAGAMEPGA